MSTDNDLRSVAEPPYVAPGDLSFVICVEANQLERQSFLLCESIREFGGRYANCRILAISPRPELALGPDATARLRDLDVDYCVEHLNRTGHPYGTINRIVAGAFAEANLRTSFLAILDTDMVLLGEPDVLAADVGARPVDVKGSASAGPDDPLDAFWSRVCVRAGVPIATLPMLETLIDKVSIRASYNGGFVVLRRSLGILEQTREIFLTVLNEGVGPLAGRGFNVRASTGLVGQQASEWWGSSQAALSAAIWSKTTDVRLYGPQYNIPLHLVTWKQFDWPLGEGLPPILVHYHHVFQPEHRSQATAALAKIHCPADLQQWIERRLERSWVAVG